MAKLFLRSYLMGCLLVVLGNPIRSVAGVDLEGVYISPQEQATNKVEVLSLKNGFFKLWNQRKNASCRSVNNPIEGGYRVNGNVIYLEGDDVAMPIRIFDKESNYVVLWDFDGARSSWLLGEGYQSESLLIKSEETEGRLFSDRQSIQVMGNVPSLYKLSVDFEIAVRDEIKNWDSSKMIPDILLRYHRVSGSSICPFNSNNLFGGIDNKNLLLSLINYSGTDPKAFIFAVERLLILFGPSSLFDDIDMDKFRNCHMDERKLVLLEDLASSKLVWIDALEVKNLGEDYFDLNALAMIEMNMMEGKSLDKSLVEYNKYLKEIYGVENKSSFVRLGLYVVSKKRKSRYPFGSQRIPEYHVEELLKRQVGEVVALKILNAEDKVILYHIRDSSCFYCSKK